MAEFDAYGGYERCCVYRGVTCLLCGFGFVDFGVVGVFCVSCLVFLRIFGGWLDCLIVVVCCFVFC